MLGICRACGNAASDSGTRNGGRGPLAGTLDTPGARILASQLRSRHTRGTAGGCSHMIEGHDIIVFANDWTGDPLSKKHIVQRLAARNRILWVNSLGNRNPTASVRDLRRAAGKVDQWMRGSRQVTDNIHVFSPLVIPYHGSPTARMLNRRLLLWSLRRACASLGFREPITWSFVPSSGEVVGSLGEKLV